VRTPNFRFLFGNVRHIWDFCLAVIRRIWDFCLACIHQILDFLLAGKRQGMACLWLTDVVGNRSIAQNGEGGIEDDPCIFDLLLTV